MYFHATDANDKDKTQKVTNILPEDSHTNDAHAIENGKHQLAVSQGSETKFSFPSAMKRITDHIVTSYSDAVVIQWSILWAFSMCGFLQVSYIRHAQYFYNASDHFNGH